MCRDKQQKSYRQNSLLHKIIILLKIVVFMVSWSNFFSVDTVLKIILIKSHSYHYFWFLLIILVRSLSGSKLLLPLLDTFYLVLIPMLLKSIQKCSWQLSIVSSIIYISSTWIRLVECQLVRHTKRYLFFELSIALHFTLDRKYPHEATFEVFSSSNERFSSSTKKQNKKSFRRGEKWKLCASLKFLYTYLCISSRVTDIIIFIL